MYLKVKLETTGKFKNAILKMAAKEWGEDRSSAEAKYGHISSWDGEHREKQSDEPGSRYSSDSEDEAHE